MPATTTSLAERYVHAVTRRLPEEQRADVADELRASIADRVESLLEERPDLDPATAEREAVAELGEPSTLAGAYTGRPRQLLGPEVYPAWERTVRAILLVAVPVSTLAFAVVQVAVGKTFGEVVGSVVWIMLSLVVHIVFWTTLVFVLAERSSADSGVRESLDVDWSPDDLPDAPQRRGSLTDLVAALTFQALLAGLLVWQQVRPPLSLDGADVPVLDPDLWRSWFPVILALLVVEAGFEVVKYRVGGWTRPLAVANVALGALFALPFVYLGWTEQLLNPDAVLAIQQDWAGFSPGTTHAVVALVAVAIWLWDSVDGFVRVHRTQGAPTR
ncbi:HAAS signaling domain-containing protein [Aeromicrobium massiliense]|uniref:HAAS signaling domain-containing protein n=1 Tax=Aeromicrobium massiliense TaxID=1464554 RepID=UPI000A7796E8|nr:permease prefix domain 1-containing protein [Aeromicrobium massiliense]